MKKLLGTNTMQLSKPIRSLVCSTSVIDERAETHRGDEKTTFRSSVESLLCAEIKRRPDIAMAKNFPGAQVENSRSHHCKTAKKRIDSSMEEKTLPCNLSTGKSTQLTVYPDANWGD